MMTPRTKSRWQGAAVGGGLLAAGWFLLGCNMTLGAEGVGAAALWLALFPVLTLVGAFFGAAVAQPPHHYRRPSSDEPYEDLSLAATPGVHIPIPPEKRTPSPDPRPPA